MLYELHLTVSPDTDIDSWSEWCNSNGCKPLDIRLAGGNPNNPRQIMFAAVTEGDDVDAGMWVDRLADGVTNAGFEIIRSKLEVPLDKSAPYYRDFEYHECHVKSLIEPDSVPTLVKFAESLGWVASTNALYQNHYEFEKWYFTIRDHGSDYIQAGREFKNAFALLPTDAFNTVRMESETVIVDSNTDLDGGWA